jgi:hypothetical protein
VKRIYFVGSHATEKTTMALLDPEKNNATNTPTTRPVPRRVR